MNQTLTPEALQRAMTAACQAGEYAELPTRVYDALIAGWHELQAAQPQEVTVPEHLDVRRIMLDVVPGEDGMGHEVYARSVEDVERKLDAMGSRISDLDHAAQPQAEQHHDDAAVDRFAVAMKAKLSAAREKGRGGWEDREQCSADDLSDMLREHVAKGDPRDVANFCMMLHQRGESIVQAEQQGAGDASAILARHMRVVAAKHNVPNLAADADTVEDGEEWDFWMEAAHAAVSEALAARQPVVQEPVAFVPVHPSIGPLWGDTYPAGSSGDGRPARYERRPLYTAPPAQAQAQVPEAEDLQAAVATLRAALCNSEPEWRALCTLMAAVPGGDAALLAAAPAQEGR